MVYIDKENFKQQPENKVKSCPAMQLFITSKYLVYTTVRLLQLARNTACHPWAVDDLEP